MEGIKNAMLKTKLIVLNGSKTDSALEMLKFYAVGICLIKTRPFILFGKITFYNYNLSEFLNFKSKYLFS